MILKHKHDSKNSKHLKEDSVSKYAVTLFVMKVAIVQLRYIFSISFSFDTHLGLECTWKKLTKVILIVLIL